MKDWAIQGEELANCNCNFGCPCQFGVSPTDGSCEAAVVYDIHKGHHGDVKLDGLRAGATYKWPGPIHEGNGEMQLVIDARADAAQRAALEAIMTGEDTEDMATMWFVFSAMSPNRHPTLSAPIELAIDREGRSGRAKVGGIFEISAAPIPHPVTGAPHRVGLNLPNGFEFTAAELASGSTRTSGGAIALAKNRDSHAHFAALHLTGAGVVRA
ncbi:DUF1326 domain-containing protein [Actibacterium sp. MT2.3-13A]|uniref:DUF1326 domain-containing protein n=1 Tax=Actibacterium sp. MT2.3-13A TaxID=2828332 RepID=UPI001BACD5D9|nr:DUF1326 domain-containing protein [Actibacterium sp. MT2.3-13A]